MVPEHETLSPDEAISGNSHGGPYDGGADYLHSWLSVLQHVTPPAGVHMLVSTQQDELTQINSKIFSTRTQTLKTCTIVVVSIHEAAANSHYIDGAHCHHDRGYRAREPVGFLSLIEDIQQTDMIAVSHLGARGRPYSHWTVCRAN